MNNKICYIISNLDIGGAELSLLKITEGLCDKYNFTIISFKKIGIVGQKLKNKGTRFKCAQKSGIKEEV